MYPYQTVPVVEKHNMKKVKQQKKTDKHPNEQAK